MTNALELHNVVKQFQDTEATLSKFKTQLKSLADTNQQATTHEQSVKEASQNLQEVLVTLQTYADSMHSVQESLLQSVKSTEKLLSELHSLSGALPGLKTNMEGQIEELLAKKEKDIQTLEQIRLTTQNFEQSLAQRLDNSAELEKERNRLLHKEIESLGQKIQQQSEALQQTKSSLSSQIQGLIVGSIVTLSAIAVALFFFLQKTGN
ncbi:MAG: hypothetical protein EP343_00920 [Deltaproteobacteria bacterium]|nr:MAG: hypothetical protein EP343_00920 [Deltaproteobacteria bacterium]